MKEFKVNDYITLKLEDGKTNIYLYNRDDNKYKLFNHCKYVLMRKTVYELEDFLEKIESVDELAEHLDRSSEKFKPESINIPPEVEFWVHCSNMQVWAENNYDTQLLHSNLAFPLLKKLSSEKIHDQIALKVFKREIMKRLINGHVSVILYLSNEGYLDYLDSNDFLHILNGWNNRIYDIYENIIRIYTKNFLKDNRAGLFELPILEKLKEINKTFVLKELIYILFERADPDVIFYLLHCNYLELLGDNELISMLEKNEISLKNLFKELISRTPQRLTIEENLALYNFSKRINKISTDYGKKKALELYKSGDPDIIHYLDSQEFDNLFLRREYYQFFLGFEEAKAIVELEESLKIKFNVYFEEVIGYDNFITIENRHVIEIDIVSYSYKFPDSFPESLLKLKQLEKSYLYMPNLEITDAQIKRLNNLKKLKNLEYKTKR